jgi:hypothetical protein
MFRQKPQEAWHGEMGVINIDVPSSEHTKAPSDQWQVDALEATMPVLDKH